MDYRAEDAESAGAVFEGKVRSGIVKDDKSFLLL